MAIEIGTRVSSLQLQAYFHLSCVAAVFSYQEVGDRLRCSFLQLQGAIFVFPDSQVIIKVCSFLWKTGGQRQPSSTPHSHRPSKVWLQNCLPAFENYLAKMHSLKLIRNPAVTDPGVPLFPLKAENK